MTLKKMFDGNGKEIIPPDDKIYAPDEGKPVDGGTGFGSGDYPDQRDNRPDDGVIKGTSGMTAEESANQAYQQHMVRMVAMQFTVDGQKRRERIAERIMAGLAAGTRFMVGSERMLITPNPEESAFVAVRMADALIRQLDSPPA